jgi:hypothetical protein
MLFNTTRCTAYLQYFEVDLFGRGFCGLFGTNATVTTHLPTLQIPILTPTRNKNPPERNYRHEFDTIREGSETAQEKRRYLNKEW